MFEVNPKANQASCGLSNRFQRCLAVQAAANDEERVEKEEKKDEVIETKLIDGKAIAAEAMVRRSYHECCGGLNNYQCCGVLIPDTATAPDTSDIPHNNLGNYLDPHIICICSSGTAAGLFRLGLAREVRAEIKMYTVPASFETELAGVTSSL